MIDHDRRRARALIHEAGGRLKEWPAGAEHPTFFLVDLPEYLEESLAGLIGLVEYQEQWEGGPGVALRLLAATIARLEQGRARLAGKIWHYAPALAGHDVETETATTVLRRVAMVPGQGATMTAEAVIDAVELGGQLRWRARLPGWDDIDRCDLRLGDTVEVCWDGAEVTVLRPLVEHRTGGEQPITPAC